MHKKIISRYKHYITRREFLIQASLSIIFFCLCYYINELAIQFATERASSPVTDIILSNTPALPVDNLFVWGTIILAIVFVALILSHPKRIPFMFKTAGFFFLVRSGFTSLTHVGPFAPHLADDFGASVNRAFFGGDLFFSGHTGLPFLAALAFWKQPRWRYFFLCVTVFFAVVVLLGHIHYSIDVASAFFITYGIYHLALWLFPRDHALFTSED